VIDDLVIAGKMVERASEYKYLGTVIDNKLNFDISTNMIHKKCQSRVLFTEAETFECQPTCFREFLQMLY
jgi:hypothetical protein